MDTDTFLRAIKGKKRETRRKVDVRYGQLANKTVHTSYTYTPLDECPRCKTYNVEYYTHRHEYAAGTDYVRGRHCENCEYTEEVDDDPSDSLVGHGGLTGVVESLMDSDREF